MADLQGEVGSLHFTVEIKRAATGKVDTYEMVGHVIPPPEQPEDTVPSTLNETTDKES